MPGVDELEAAAADWARRARALAPSGRPSVDAEARAAQRLARQVRDVDLSGGASTAASPARRVRRPAATPGRPPADRPGVAAQARSAERLARTARAVDLAGAGSTAADAPQSDLLAAYRRWRSAQVVLEGDPVAEAQQALRKALAALEQVDGGPTAKAAGSPRRLSGPAKVDKAQHVLVCPVHHPQADPETVEKAAWALAPARGAPRHATVAGDPTGAQVVESGIHRGSPWRTRAGAVPPGTHLVGLRLDPPAWKAYQAGKLRGVVRVTSGGSLELT